MSKRYSNILNVIDSFNSACVDLDNSINEPGENADESVAKKRKLESMERSQTSKIRDLENELMICKVKIEKLEAEKELEIPVLAQDNIEKQSLIGQLQGTIDKQKIREEELWTKIKTLKQEQLALHEKNKEGSRKLVKQREEAEKEKQEWNQRIVGMEEEMQRLKDQLRAFESGNSVGGQVESRMKLLESERDNAIRQERMLRQSSENLLERLKELQNEVASKDAEINALRSSMIQYRNGEDIIMRAEQLKEKLNLLDKWEVDLLNLKKMNESLLEERDNINLMREKTRILDDLKASMTTLRERCSKYEVELEVNRKLISDWEQELVKFDPSLNSPAAVVEKLNKLRHSEVCLLEEICNLKTKVALGKADDEAKVAEESKEVSRLKRKLKLITRERDSYKNVLDSYESDITINPSTVQNKHLMNLEKIVQEYRVLVSELEGGGSGKSLNAVSIAVQSDVGESGKEKEMRLIHWKDNPLDIAHKLRVEQWKAAEEENAKLKARIQVLEEKGCDAVNVTMDMRDVLKSSENVKQLKAELEASKKRQERMMTAFKKTSKEFRQVVYCLTGYKVDMVGSKCVLTNIYADSPNDFLEFSIGEDGLLHMLGTEYSCRLSELIETYLSKLDSIPAFLSAHTMHLFNSQTMMQIEQPSMFID